MSVGVPRLIDVAQRSGVSVATVSRHLNGRIQLPGATVTREAAAISARLEDIAADREASYARVGISTSR